MQVFNQMAAKTGQALERGIAHIELIGRGELAAIAHPLGDQKGVGVVTFRQRTKVGPNVALHGCKALFPP